MAPSIVGESLKGAELLAQVMQTQLGYPCFPPPGSFRTDIIQAVQLGTRKKVHCTDHTFPSTCCWLNELYCFMYICTCIYVNTHTVDFILWECATQESSRSTHSSHPWPHSRLWTRSYICWRNLHWRQHTGTECRRPAQGTLRCILSGSSNSISEY